MDRHTSRSRSLAFRAHTKQIAKWMAALVWERGKQLNTVQVHVWALIISILCGLVVTAYDFILKKSLKLIWHTLPHALVDAHVFNRHFPAWNYIWIVAIIFGFLLGICLEISKRIRFFRGPGSIPDLIDKLHRRGYLGANHISPMIIAIVSGGSAGPEAVVMIVCAGLAGKIVFFGLPFGGAIFVLELPHQMGLQYYEAISPAILASLVSVLIKKAIDRNRLGGHYMFPSVGELHAIDLLKAVLLGLVGTLIASLFVGILKTFKLITEHKWIRNYKWIIATMGGIGIGIIGALLPSTLFWSENEIQFVLSRGTSPLPNVPPFIGSALDHVAFLQPPWDWRGLLFLGCLKLLSIAWTVACEYPGGIIFPTFYAGAAFGYAFSYIAPSQFQPSLSMLCMMGAVEVAITRTPWATTILLIQLQGGFYGRVSTSYIAQLPVIATAVVVSLFFTKWLRLYPQQRNRSDVRFKDHDDHQRMYEEFDKEITVRSQSLLSDIRQENENVGSFWDDTETSRRKKNDVGIDSDTFDLETSRDGSPTRLDDFPEAFSLNSRQPTIMDL